MFVRLLQGATSFVDNEVADEGSSNPDAAGAALFSFSDEPMVFSGPVTVTGNNGTVSANISNRKTRHATAVRAVSTA